jgi:hypothetical protein
MSTISVSDSSEPNWDLVASDSEDTNWPPSTICTKLYPIFLLPEAQDTDDDKDQAAEEDESKTTILTERKEGGNDADPEWQGRAPAQKRKLMKSESSQQGKSKCA